MGAAVGRGPPLRLEGERDITIGAGTWFGSGCWLNAIGGTITVGDGCSFAGDVTISAAASVMLGRDLLVARGVHIGDHDHAFTDPGRPARRQGIANAAPVMIGDGAWLGHNVTVTAGVSIGRGAVIAAGAVVTRDVPPYSLAVGIPGRWSGRGLPLQHPPSRQDRPSTSRRRLRHMAACGELRQNLPVGLDYHDCPAAGGLCRPATPAPPGTAPATCARAEQLYAGERACRTG